jgi:hypothetical protein
VNAARRRLLSCLAVFALLLSLTTLHVAASAAPGRWADPPNGYPESRVPQLIGFLGHG